MRRKELPPGILILGPVTASGQRDRVESYMRIGRDEGAPLVLGGGRKRGFDTGYFLEPTIFTGKHSGCLGSVIARCVA